MDLNRFESIIKLLIPKYYNNNTYFLLALGGGLVAKPIWIDLINWIVSLFNITFDFRLDIIGEFDWVLGLVIILLGLIYNTIHVVINLKYSPIQQPAYKEVENLSYNTLIELSVSINPILKDNEHTFRTFGPNSGSNYMDELRTDLTLWKKYRNETIRPNNAKIKELLITNKHLFDQEFHEKATKMIAHIDAFEEHLNNPKYDHSKYQFPSEFKKMIQIMCFNNTIKTKSFKRKTNWIATRLNRINAKEIYFFGSFVFTPENAKDVDVVIILNEKSTLEKYKLLDEIAMQTKARYKINLHITPFFNGGEKDFKEFIEYNEFKYKGHGKRFTLFN